jgi:transforming growth factor-beta-induced protein
MIVQKLLPIAVAGAVIFSVLAGASAAFGQPATSAATGKPTQSILSILAHNANFTTFVRLVNKTYVNKTNITETLNGPGSFTVFAPTNAAFAKLGNATLADLTNNTTALSAVVSYHIVPQAFLPDNFTGNGTLGTLNPNNARLSFSLDGTTLKVDNAVVNTKEINATNGVIYAIDSVVMPTTTAAATETAGGGFLGLPGFEAVYAVAGLLVVSYLVMRRRK